MSPAATTLRLEPHPQRLAYAPTPLDDEPLDGYLEHVASVCGRAPADIHRQIGLTNLRPYSIVRTLAPDQAQRLGEATGLPTSRLHAMTLQRYDHLGLMPSFDKRGHGSGTWPRGSGGRYCPDCLNERNLRWRLPWYLQWTFACTRHQQLLYTDCPECGRTVRSRPHGHPIEEVFFSTIARTDQPDCVCSTIQLAARAPSCHQTGDVAALAPVLLSQEVIDGVIHGRPGSSVFAFGTERSRPEWLHDLASLTRLLMTHLPVDQLPPGYEHVLTAEHVLPELDALTGWSDGLVGNRQGPRTSNQRSSPGHGVLDFLNAWGGGMNLRATGSAGVRLGDATTSPSAIAATASVAAIVLMSPNVATASELLTVLPDKARTGAVQKSASRGLSWPLIQALDVPNTTSRGRPARARLLRLQSARFLTDGTTRAPLDPAKVPAAAWRTLCAAHPEQLRDGYGALAASIALMAMATRTGILRASMRLGHPHLGTIIEKQLASVLGLDHEPDEDHDPTLFDDLLLLHGALVAGHVPIDYARRRRTFTEPVPPAERTARQIAREIGQRPTPRLRRFMGWWVYEILTGGDVLLHERRLEMHATHRLAYARQRSQWLAHPPPELLRRAEHALLRNRLDEPLTWSPVRHLDGSWHCPSARIERQLDWSNRPGRSSTRLDGSTTDGLDLHDAVRFACSTQTLAAHRLAVKLARFAAVADIGAITKAAGHIGIKQSSLSSSIATLERELSASLIDRNGFGVSLTPAGRHLHRLLRGTPILAVDPALSLRPSDLSRVTQNRTIGQSHSPSGAEDDLTT